MSPNRICIIVETKTDKVKAPDSETPPKYDPPVDWIGLTFSELWKKLSVDGWDFESVGEFGPVKEYLFFK